MHKVDIDAHIGVSEVLAPLVLLAVPRLLRIKKRKRSQSSVPHSFPRCSQDTHRHPSKISKIPFQDTWSKHSGGSQAQSRPHNSLCTTGKLACRPRPAAVE